MAQDFKSNVDIIRHEMDDHGNHRLRLGEKKGSWTDFQHVASLTLNGEIFVAFTDFYDGVLPTEKALRLTDAGSMFQLVDGHRPE
jgi:hypothetical protein